MNQPYPVRVASWTQPATLGVRLRLAGRFSADAAVVMGLNFGIRELSPDS